MVEHMSWHKFNSAPWELWHIHVIEKRRITLKTHSKISLMIIKMWLRVHVARDLVHLGICKIIFHLASHSHSIQPPTFVVYDTSFHVPNLTHYQPIQSRYVYLCLLINDLNLLWEDGGVHTWDTLLRYNFQMWATLLWTIRDFLAYGTLFGWHTYGSWRVHIAWATRSHFNFNTQGRQYGLIFWAIINIIFCSVTNCHQFR